MDFKKGKEISELIESLKSELSHTSKKSNNTNLTNLSNSSKKSINNEFEINSTTSNIINDLENVKNSIVKEIEQIESDLKKIGNKDSSEQLKNIKKDCLALIYEIDERKKEIDSLSQN